VWQLTGGHQSSAKQDGPSDEITTTLSSSLDGFISKMLEMAKQVKLKADLLFRELVEPTDQYCKHYTATNSILLE